MVKWQPRLNLWNLNGYQAEEEEVDEGEGGMDADDTDINEWDTEDGDVMMESVIVAESDISGTGSGMDVDNSGGVKDVSMTSHHRSKSLSDMIGLNEVYGSPQKWKFKSVDCLDGERMAKNGILKDSGGLLKRSKTGSPIIIKDSVIRREDKGDEKDELKLNDVEMEDFKLDGNEIEEFKLDGNDEYKEEYKVFSKQTRMFWGSKKEWCDNWPRIKGSGRLPAPKYCDLMAYFSYIEDEEGTAGYDEVLTYQEFVIQYWKGSRMIYEEGLSCPVMPEGRFYTEPQIISRHPFDAVTCDAIVVVMAASNPQSNWNGWHRWGENPGNIVDINYMSKYMDVFPR